jgi:excisionase family DNA binding protein
MGRRPNHRLAKIHRSYTVEEVARRLNVHKNTVRDWVRGGLPTIDARRPALIAGIELRRFLEAKSKRRKQPCAPGELYCVRCRAPKAPAGAMADYIPITSTSGNLRGLCPDCETLIHRRVAYAKLNNFRAFLDVTVLALPSIRESNDPSLSCDSETEDQTHADKQPR